MSGATLAKVFDSAAKSRRAKFGGRRFLERALGRVQILAVRGELVVTSDPSWLSPVDTWAWNGVVERQCACSPAHGDGNDLDGEILALLHIASADGDQ
jgi:hypothetical protein